MNFDNLRENLTEKLKLKNWIAVTTSHHSLYIFNLNKKLNGNLAIRNTISVDINLAVKVFGEINDDIIFDLKLCRWAQLQILIEQLSNVKHEDDLDFVCVLDKDRISDAPAAEIEDDCSIYQQEDAATFEFCGIDGKMNVSVN